jgi:hypothetical protein
MSQIRDRDWIFNNIEKLKGMGKKQYITSGGPCSQEIVEELRRKGYEVQEFSDFEIIEWS